MTLAGTGCRGARLREDTRSIGKCVPNRCTELPKNLTQCLLELLIDNHVLIKPKIF